MFFEFRIDFNSVEDPRGDSLLRSTGWYREGFPPQSRRSRRSVDMRSEFQNQTDIVRPFSTEIESGRSLQY